MNKSKGQLREIKVLWNKRCMVTVAMGDSYISCIQNNNDEDDTRFWQSARLFEIFIRRSSVTWLESLTAICSSRWRLTVLQPGSVIASVNLSLSYGAKRSVTKTWLRRLFIYLKINISYKNLKIAVYAPFLSKCHNFSENLVSRFAVIYKNINRHLYL